MVYLKKLTIQGFKSFGSRRISIEVGKGLVVVTGPNGGGKSNILDAIRFALGELSAHNLRVGRMAELVHDDPSTNWARVSITLDNSDGALPIDSSDVTISRRISRSGESEYYVNGRQVSRNELLTMLSMANLKPSGFNIVPQGSVVEIAEKSGAELRKMLEEVAGISDYEKRKAEAEEQLAIAEKNLAIARASAKEVKARVKQLEKERNQAHRRRLVEEFLNGIRGLRLERSLENLRRELEEVDRRLLSIEEEISDLEAERKELGARKALLEKRLESEKAGLNELESRLSDLDLRRKAAESRASELRVKISTLKERIERIRKERSYLISLRESLGKRLRELETVREKLKEDEASLGMRLEEAREAERSALEKLKSLERRYHDLRSRMEAERRELREKRLRLESELAGRKARIRELEEKLRRAVDDSSSLLESERRKYLELSRILEKLKLASEKESRIDAALKSSEERLRICEERVRRVEELERGLTSLLERIASTGALEPDQGFDRIPEVLREAGVEGVKGLLRDALDADDRTLGLIESMSGGWLESLVVEDLGTALKLARTFSKLGLKIKIIPLDVASKAGAKPRLRGISFRVRWAEKVLGYLLRDARFSNRLKLPESGKIVFDGMIIHSDLRLETAPPDEKLLRKLISREYRASMEVVKELRARIEENRRMLEELSEEVEELRAEKYRVSAERSRLEELAGRSYEEALKRILEEIEVIRKTRELEEELSEEKLRLEKVKAEIEAVERAEADISHLELRELEKELEKLRSVHEDRRLRRVELELKLRDLEERVSSLDGELRRISRELGNLENRISLADSERGEAERLIREHSTALRMLELELGELAYGLATLFEEGKNARERIEGIESGLKPLSEKLTSIEEEVRRREPLKSSLQIRRAQLEVQLKNLRERLSSLGEAGLEWPQLDDDVLDELSRELEGELRELEMINQLAPAQYEELIGNYKIRSARIAELEAERREILKFMEWIEGEKRRIFMETFDKVAEAFEEYFNRLTGGRGWLRLENPENPFDGGIEMILAFPGKQPRSSRAASGGEKSVAAVALLLALQGLTPADFYVFDEVDAHMDLEYSRRLAELFEEMAKQTQIIVISLKDVVVGKADQVIGVYSAGGASRVVKTRLEEVIRND